MDMSQKDKLKLIGAVAVLVLAGVLIVWSFMGGDKGDTLAPAVVDEAVQGNVGGKRVAPGAGGQK